jgi:hypothetical protein
MTFANERDNFAAARSCCGLMIHQLASSPSSSEFNAPSEFHLQWSETLKGSSCGLIVVG